MCFILKMTDTFYGCEFNQMNLLMVDFNQLPGEAYTTPLISICNLKFDIKAIALWIRYFTD